MKKSQIMETDTETMSKLRATKFFVNICDRKVSWREKTIDLFAGSLVVGEVQRNWQPELPTRM